ncbi:MAG: hypothetical protein B6I36_07110 [Desulfobacteraceae bacterium 4572_35.1]|nr:MAG: hypothetical protein B6I36_07110 [Desulfobacteraceae bacterium 4572_35.1]
MPALKITIRTNILSYFLTSVGIVACSLIAIQYFSSLDLARNATNQIFQQTAARISLGIRNHDLQAKSLLYQIETGSCRADATADPVPLDTVRNLTGVLKHHRSIYSIYFGYPNGDLFQVVNMDNVPELRRSFSAPAQTRWSILRVHAVQNRRVRDYTFLDKELRRVGQARRASDYDATLRPWYVSAIRTGNAVRSDPYTFDSLNSAGITYSKVLPAVNAVLGIDFTLEALHTMLCQQMFAPSSQLVLLGRNGKIISSSRDDAASLTPQLDDLIGQHAVNSVITTTCNGEKYFVMMAPISAEMGTTTLLGISVLCADMLEPYMSQIYYSLFIGLVLLLVALPVIVYATGSIVKPIRTLMAENEKIKNRRFADIQPVHTHIIELNELSASQVAMAGSIGIFQTRQKELLDSFIKLIAEAIDAKSAYTGAHCKRVPILATMLARAASASTAEPFKDFQLNSDEQWEEFERGAWLHDCGKITTPEHVVDKGSKLETIYNRIHEIRTRCEVIWRDIEIAFLNRLHAGEDKQQLELWRDKEQQQLLDNFNFIAACNNGTQPVGPSEQQRLKQIAQRTWSRHFDNSIGLSPLEQLRLERKPQSLPVCEQLLCDKAEHLIPRSDNLAERYQHSGFKLAVPRHQYNHGELYNLCVARGTLTEEERFKINEHVIMTSIMLSQLPYPDYLHNIPDIAANHHEALDGSGYPRGLHDSEISLAARIIAIADIFEALTASDRPYKKANSLEQALTIMVGMCRAGHIDRHLMKLFLTEKIHITYAEKYLDQDNTDHVEIKSLLSALNEHQ